MKKEIWNDVEGFEGLYQVSNKGRVSSLERVVGNGRGGVSRLKERTLKARIGSDGYQMVALYKDGARQDKKIASLVAVSFLNHIPDGYNSIVDHIDGVRDNDDLSNLRVVTQRENASTCFRSNEDSFSSNYVGVSWNRLAGKWESGIYIKGEQIHLGHFDCEEEASNKYQKALENIDNPDYLESIKRKVTSKYKGVCFNKRQKKYMSRITINGKRKYLGMFKIEVDAYLAYEKALLKL